MDFDRVAIGTVPLGTGNDFSRTFGWGAMRNNYCKPLIGRGQKNLIRDVTAW